ncbi:hypothetical protein [Stackebrandtia nassauensis]|uniref:hypothetical protein n=1 Tax=Stackebrandtia nassauensis TaxID=283811 RepID=UPI0001A3A39D|nr:hypothetical protein [Stackebrandtia nassauensis]
MAIGAIVVVLLGIGGVVWTDSDDDPETVVTQFFDAIEDKNVDRALSFVSPDGYGVPAGDEAVFLDEDAISDDWRLLVVKQRSAVKSDGSAVVDVVLGDGKSTKAGVINVDDKYGQWQVVDPFIKVRFESASLSYLKVNDKTVVRQELYAHDVTNREVREYRLFPGMNAFFGNLKGTTGATAPGKLLLPTENSGDKALRVSPPKLKFTDTARKSVQDGVEAIVDDCVRFAMPQPSRCPFGVDSPHTDEFGVAYGDFDDVTWKLKKYPKVRLKDPGDDGDDTGGMPIKVDDPGSISLTAAAVTQDAASKAVTLTADCRFTAEPLRAVLGPDGKARVIPLGQSGSELASISFDLDTCGSDSSGGGS